VVFTRLVTGGFEESSSRLMHRPNAQSPLARPAEPILIALYSHSLHDRPVASFRDRVEAEGTATVGRSPGWASVASAYDGAPRARVSDWHATYLVIRLTCA